MRRGVPFLSKGQLLISPETGCEGQLCLRAAGARQSAHMQACFQSRFGLELHRSIPLPSATTRPSLNTRKTAVLKDQRGPDCSKTCWSRAVQVGSASCDMGLEIKLGGWVFWCICS